MYALVANIVVQRERALHASSVFFDEKLLSCWSLIQHWNYGAQQLVIFMLNVVLVCVHVVQCVVLEAISGFLNSVNL